MEEKELEEKLKRLAFWIKLLPDKWIASFIIRRINMNGIRTYLTLFAGVILNVLTGMGIVDISSDDLVNALNVIILVVAGVFRYLATKKSAAPK